MLSCSRPYRAGEWVGPVRMCVARQFISMTRPSVVPSMLRLRSRFSNWHQRRYDAVFFQRPSKWPRGVKSDEMVLEAFRGPPFPDFHKRPLRAALGGAAIRPTRSASRNLVKRFFNKIKQ